MSELGRPFGLTFEDREEPASLPVAPLAPDVGRPFDMNFGEGTENSGPADAPSAAAPPAVPEPVATIDGVATPPAAPQAAPIAGEAGAMSAAEGERERRLVQSKAEYDSYLQKVMYAAGKMATDDGRAALIHDIIRHKRLNTVEGYDQVDRNFLSEERDYRIDLTRNRSPEQQHMAQGSRGAAWQAIGDEAAMNDAKARLKDAGIWLPRDPWPERTAKSVENWFRGWPAAGGEVVGDLWSFDASLDVRSYHKDIKDMESVLRGKFRPDNTTSRKVRDFIDASPQKKAVMYENQRQLVETHITDHPDYKRGREIAQSTDIWPADRGYDEDREAGKEFAKNLVTLPASASIVGIPFVIASESGSRTRQAIELGATPEQYLKVQERSMALAALAAIPVGKLLVRNSGVDKALTRLEVAAGPGGTKVLRVGGDVAEAAAIGGLEAIGHGQIIKGVFDPERDTSDGALQAAIRSFSRTGDGPEIKQTLTAVEVDGLRAQATRELAGNLAKAMSAVQHGMRISNDPHALSLYVDFSIPNEAVAMPIAEFDRLVKSKTITPEIVKQWSVQDQVDNGGIKGQIIIPLRRLMKARLAPEQIGDIVDSLRLGEKTLTGREAADFLKQRDATLGELATRMKAANPVPDEGAFIFADASNRLRQAGWSNEDAERGAARLVERFIDTAREDKNRAAKQGADFLYYREVARSEGSPANTPADAKLKQEFDAFSKMREEIRKPVGPRRPAAAPDARRAPQHLP